MDGLDFLGADHKLFPLKMTANNTPKDFAIGVFWSAFSYSSGNDNAADVVQFYINEGFKTFRIQLWWSNTHVIVPEGVCRKGAKQVEALAKKNPGVTFYLSHSCEHGERDVETVKKRMAILREHAPSCIPVNAPMRGTAKDGIFLEGEINETHNINEVPKGKYIVSTDGKSLYDIDAEGFRKKHAGAILRMGWGARYNLREVNDPGELPPPISQRNAVPSREYHNGIVRLMFAEGTAPQANFPAKPVKDPSLYKPYAEDDQEPNPNEPDSPRENRPMLMLPVDKSSLDIVTKDGRSIGKLIKEGTFPGGLWRYYSGKPGGVNLYGFQIGKKALNLSGSEWVWFKAGNKYFGPVNPAFRAGYFR